MEYGPARYRIPQESRWHQVPSCGRRLPPRLQRPGTTLSPEPGRPGLSPPPAGTSDGDQPGPRRSRQPPDRRGTPKQRPSSRPSPSPRRVVRRGRHSLMLQRRPSIPPRKLRLMTTRPQLHSQPHHHLRDAPHLRHRMPIRRQRLERAPHAPPGRCPQPHTRPLQRRKRGTTSDRHDAAARAEAGHDRMRRPVTLHQRPWRRRRYCRPAVGQQQPPPHVQRQRLCRPRR